MPIFSLNSNNTNYFDIFIAKIHNLTQWFFNKMNVDLNFSL